MSEIQATVGFVGYGEAASCFTKGLSGNGLQRILVYCNGSRNRPPYTQPFKDRVAADGAQTVDSLEDLVSDSDIVFSAVLVGNAVEVGEAIAACVDAGTLVVDINASPPSAKKAVGAAVTAQGASFVDANLIGAVSIYGHSVQLLSSGDGSVEFARRMGPFGLNVEVIGNDPGTSAMVKMLRSVVTKGMEALIVEAMTAAHLAGITEEAFRGICEPMDATTYSSFADMCIKTDVLHAGRRAVEMDAALAELRELGVEPIMTTATVERLRTSERLGLRDRFVDAPPKNYEEVLDAYTAVIRGTDPV